MKNLFNNEELQPHLIYNMLEKVTAFELNFSRLEITLHFFSVQYSTSFIKKLKRTVKFIIPPVDGWSQIHTSALVKPVRTIITITVIKLTNLHVSRIKLRGLIS